LSPAVPALILASASPRRAELIARLGVEPAAVEPADIDETPFKGEAPAPYAARVAAAKAALVAARRPGCAVLGADTVVAAGRRILPKTDDAQTARACLELLSGRRHRVYSAVTLINAGGVARHRLSTSIVAYFVMGTSSPAAKPNPAITRREFRKSAGFCACVRSTASWSGVR